MSSIAVVLVTYNRAELLVDALAALAQQTHPPAAIYVVNNNSTDHTAAVLAEHTPKLGLTVINTPKNIGGAGGFSLGLQQAYAAGHDRFFLIDDDVLPAPDCLAALAAHPGPALQVVREDMAGNIVEKAALKFDLKRPWYPRPKREMVEDKWSNRSDMPAQIEIENVAFEGFLVNREVVEAVGFPNPEFFIFYDDCEYAIRIREAGFRIYAIPKAVLRRQLPFDQEAALHTWKGYYMYRNLFAVHFIHGENWAVRAKPYLLTAALLALAPVRGGREEFKNLWKAIKDAPKLAKTQPPQ